MNKKLIYRIVLPLFLIFSIVLVSAIYVGYGEVSQEIIDAYPIQVESSPEVITNFIGYETIVKGKPILISNVAEVGSIDVEVYNDAPDGVTVSYLAKLELYSKTTDTWVEYGDASIIYYTTIGNDFVVESDNEGMMVINYIEPSEIYTGAFNLPTDITDSFTKGEKLWLVPDTADADSNKMLDSWTPELFKFEHNVVDYTKGASGIITIPQGETIELIPVYTITSGTEGVTTITTNVDSLDTG